MHVVSSESQRPVMPDRAIARAQSRPLATREPTKKKAAPLDPKVADRLLDLLSTDNAFRRLFKKDPLAALVEAGWEPSNGATNSLAPAACLKVTRIASKTQIMKARKEIRDLLTNGLGFVPHRLDATT